MQPSYTQKRTVKRILIRCGSYGYSANFHALRLCSHVRFCVRNGHVVTTVSCQGRYHPIMFEGKFWQRQWFIKLIETIHSR